MEIDLPVDPNEPTYCYCNRVSYGEMIACDNPEVKTYASTKVPFSSVPLGACPNRDLSFLSLSSAR